MTSRSYSWTGGLTDAQLRERLTKFLGVDPLIDTRISFWSAQYAAVGHARRHLDEAAAENGLTDDLAPRFTPQEVARRTRAKDMPAPVGDQLRGRVLEKQIGAGRPAERAIDDANLFLVSSFPSVDFESVPYMLAALERLLRVDLAEARYPIPTPEEWSNDESGSKNSLRSARERSDRRIARAKELQAEGRSVATSPPPTAPSPWDEVPAWVREQFTGRPLEVLPPTALSDPEKRFIDWLVDAAVAEATKGPKAP